MKIEYLAASGGKIVSEDDELMIRMQAGDGSAFEELVSRYQNALIGFFFRNTHDNQLSEDLTQDTLLKLYNQSWDYLPSGRFRPWMYRIARNLLIDNVRRQSHDALVKAVKVRRCDEDDLLQRLASDLTSPEEQAHQREIATIVDDLLGRLPEDQRQTFVLYHYSGLSLPEVAEVMEVPVPTSKSRLRLAREKLREHLGRMGVAHSESNDD